jgi:hypothetical protein
MAFLSVPAYSIAELRNPCKHLFLDHLHSLARHQRLGLPHIVGYRNKPIPMRCLPLLGFSVPTLAFRHRKGTAAGSVLALAVVCPSSLL